MAPATPPHRDRVRRRRGALADPVLGARGNATLAVGARGSAVAARAQVAGGLVVVWSVPGVPASGTQISDTSPTRARTDTQRPSF